MDNDRVNRSLPVVALALVVVVGVLLRVVWLPQQPPTADEAFSWRLIQYGTPEMIERTAADVHPPLYYLILKGWSALFGHSIICLRALSVVASVLTIPAMYALAAEASHKVTPPHMRVWGALFTAALVAFHVDQVAAARTARMYSFGVFLTAITSWLLLRLLRTNRCAYGALYVVVAAGLCYTHYFGLFVIAAHVIVAIIHVLMLRKGERLEARRAGKVLVLVFMMLFLAYLPWAPFLYNQIQDVQRDYWIPPVSLQFLSKAALSWATGLKTPITIEYWYATTVLLSVICLLCLCRRPSIYLFGGVAIAPWICCLIWSAVFAQSIFHERYLIFSQVGLFGLYGSLLPALAKPSLALTAAWAIGSIILWASFQAQADLPRHQPAAVSGMAYISQQLRSNDVMLTTSQRELNILLYYARQAGKEDLDVRCLISRVSTGGHIVHVASFEQRDLLTHETIHKQGFNRIWCLSLDQWQTTLPLPAGMSLIQRRSFQQGFDKATVVLYSYPPPPGEKVNERSK